MAGIFFSGQATSFGALDPGLCFAFERAGKAHIGLKVRDDAGGGAADSCVVVWAEGGDAPALLPKVLPGDCPVLSLPDATFQPALDPAHIQTEGTGQREAGQLLLAEDRWLLVVGDGDGTALIDVTVGRPHPRGPRCHSHPLSGLAARSEGARRRVRHDLPPCREAPIQGRLHAGLASHFCLNASATGASAK